MHSYIYIIYVFKRICSSVPPQMKHDVEQFFGKLLMQNVVARQAAPRRKGRSESFGGNALLRLTVPSGDSGFIGTGLYSMCSKCPESATQRESGKKGTATSIKVTVTSIYKSDEITYKEARFKFGAVRELELPT